MKDNIWDNPHIKVYIRNQGDNGTWSLKIYELERLLHLIDEKSDKVTEFTSILDCPIYLFPNEIYSMQVWTEEGIEKVNKQRDWERNNAITEG